MSKRRYTKRRRAEQEAETRQRIIEATAVLHRERGPRDTSISAIADRAGVQRLTVYRHFPDDNALFQACTGHWLERHPPPDSGLWRAIDDPEERTRTALKAVYDYYRATAGMWRMAYRDLEEVPALHEPLAGFESGLQSIRDDLAAVWGAGPGDRAYALLGHALQFSTWASLSRQTLTEDNEADLMTACVANLAAGNA